MVTGTLAVAVQEQRVLLQSRAQKQTVRGLIVASHDSRVHITCPSRTTLGFLHAPSGAVVRNDISGVRACGLAIAGGKLGLKAVLIDAVGALCEVIYFGAGNDFVEVCLVGLPAGLEGGDLGRDYRVVTGDGEVAKAHGLMSDPGWVNEVVGEG